MVEYNLAKVGVAGSIPVSRSYYVRKRISRDGNPFFSSSCIVHLHDNILGMISEVLAEQVHAAYMGTVLVYLQDKGEMVSFFHLQGLNGFF